jgi:hypothetical protein
MPLFGRKNTKAQQVRMGDTSGMVPLVQTPAHGVRPLQPILDALWGDIAATGWDGYQLYGRGSVGFDPETGEIYYVSAERIQHLPDPEKALALCRKNDPATQVVFVTEIVHTRGFRRDPQTFGTILTMPEGGLSPLAAYELVYGGA